MRKIWIITLFPDYFTPLLETSGVIARALKDLEVEIHLVPIREYAYNSYGSVDDSPFGGHPGVILRVDVLARALLEGVIHKGNYLSFTSVWEKKIKFKGLKVIGLSPKGRVLNQEYLKEFSKHFFSSLREEEVSENDSFDLVLVCGRYEGIDERFNALFVEEEISIGDFILSGGEIAALAFLDSLLRLCPGVLGNANSTKEESFENNLLSSPKYTRPREFMGLTVPPIYLSGNHKEIARFDLETAKDLTKVHRPDLYKRYLEN